jgi:alpha-tubulin suppressor-like RCC1 family protein
LAHQVTTPQLIHTNNIAGSIFGVDITATAQTSYVIMSDGLTYGFGKGVNGQLGYTPTAAKLGLPGTPVAIPTGNALGRKLYGGTFSQAAFVLTNNKTCYALGGNTNGQVRKFTNV